MLEVQTQRQKKYRWTPPGGEVSMDKMERSGSMQIEQPGPAELLKKKHEKATPVQLLQPNDLRRDTKPTTSEWFMTL